MFVVAPGHSPHSPTQCTRPGCDEDESAAWAGGDPGQWNRQVLFGDVEVEGGEFRCERGQHGDGDVLAGAAVTSSGVPAALRDELVGAGFSSGEALRIEAVRGVPQFGVMVVPVPVEQDQGVLRDGLALPGQVGRGQAADERGEGTEAPHLVGDRLRVLPFGVLAEQLPAMAVQSSAISRAAPSESRRPVHAQMERARIRAVSSNSTPRRPPPQSVTASDH